MSKLITAKEAVALSKFDDRVEDYISQIDKDIKRACAKHKGRTMCFLSDCSDKEAIKIAAHLRAADYCFSWRNSFINNNDIVFTISWGGH